MWFVYGLAIMGGFSLSIVVAHVIAALVTTIRGLVKPADVPDDAHHAFSDDGPHLRVVK